MKVKNAINAKGKEVIIKHFEPHQRSLELYSMTNTIGKVGKVEEVLQHGEKVKLKVRFPDTYWWYYNDVVKFKK